MGRIRREKQITHTHIYTDIHAGKPFARERDRSFSFSSPIIIFTSTIRDFKDWCTLIDDIFYN